MKYNITYNNQKIFYEIIHKNVKNTNIRIKPTGDIVISCNTKVSLKTIELEIIKRVNWLIKSINDFKNNYINFEKIDKNFINNENIQFLGKTLKIKLVSSKINLVKYDERYLYIFSNCTRNKSKIIQLFKKYILEIFKVIFEKSYEKYKKIIIEKPNITLRTMKTRWGSCNINKKNITLNTQLIKVEELLIEYVICHELTHLIYKNHSKSFYSFLSSVIPDWKQRKLLLHNLFKKEKE